MTPDRQLKPAERAEMERQLEEAGYVIVEDEDWPGAYVYYEPVMEAKSDTRYSTRDEALIGAFEELTRVNSLKDTQ